MKKNSMDMEVITKKILKAIMAPMAPSSSWFLEICYISLASVEQGKLVQVQCHQLQYENSCVLKRVKICQLIGFKCLGAKA